MSRWVLLAALMPLLYGCAVDRGEASSSNRQAALQSADPAPQTYALGTALTRDGAVVADTAADTFVRGGEVFLSVNVESSTTDQNVEIIWYGPGGTPRNRDARHVQKGARYVAFSSGPTNAWPTGRHRADVVIDGRKVAGLPFVLIAP